MIEKETKQVEIKIGSDSKLVEISRLSANHTWVCRTAVLVRFPTGNKVHRCSFNQAHERKDGTFFLTAGGFRNANRARVYAWDNGEIAISKWRG